MKISKSERWFKGVSLICAIAVVLSSFTQVIFAEDNNIIDVYVQLGDTVEQKIYLPAGKIIDYLGQVEEQLPKARETAFIQAVVVKEDGIIQTNIVAIGLDENNRVVYYKEDTSENNGVVLEEDQSIRLQYKTIYNIQYTYDFENNANGSTVEGPMFVYDDEDLILNFLLEEKNYVKTVEVIKNAEVIQEYSSSIQNNQLTIPASDILQDIRIRVIFSKHTHYEVQEGTIANGFICATCTKYLSDDFASTNQPTFSGIEVSNDEKVNFMPDGQSAIFYLSSAPAVTSGGGERASWNLTSVKINGEVVSIPTNKEKNRFFETILQDGTKIAVKYIMDHQYGTTSHEHYAGEHSESSIYYIYIYGARTDYVIDATFNLESKNMNTYQVHYYREVLENSNESIERNGKHYVKYYSTLTFIGTIGSEMIASNNHTQDVLDVDWGRYTLNESESILSLKNLQSSTQEGWMEYNQLYYFYDLVPFGSLEIKNTVFGKLADLQKEFKYTILINDNNKKDMEFIVSSSVENKEIPSVVEGKEIVVFLKDGESLKIEGLSQNANYVIKQEEDSYETLPKVTYSQGKEDATAIITGNQVQGLIVQADVVEDIFISFENTMPYEIVDTGLYTDVTLYKMTLMVIGLISISFISIKKFKKKN